MDQLQENKNAKAPKNNETYDFIIVGGGSAGCVIASRLSELTHLNILLLEAGESGEYIATIDTPARWLENIGSAHDYLYQYAPSPLLNNRLIYAPRGKVLGGSGSINAMVWARGHQDDYNGWAAKGNKGWEYQDVLPLFKKIEDWQGGETDFHGAGGPMHIETPKEVHFIDKAFMEAAQSYGMSFSDDINGPRPEGVGPMNTNTHKGVRCSPYSGYLKPVMHRENLTVITGAKVLKLNLDGNRCIGVIYLKDGKQLTAHASNEVILSAGAIESPRLLMLLRGLIPLVTIEYIKKSVFCTIKALFEKVKKNDLCRLLQFCFH